MIPTPSTRFRDEREADWQRLEKLLDAAERGRLSRLSDDDLMALPVLYRSTLSALSTARDTSLDRELVQYLEWLGARAYFVVYGVHEGALKRVGLFLSRAWPAAAKAIWRETVLAAALLIVGAVVGYILVTRDATWYGAFVPGEMAGGRSPAASTESLRATLYDNSKASAGLATFSTYLFTNNAKVSMVAFALGFAFGVPTMLVLIYTGCMAGALMALFAGRGLGIELAGWLAIHGTTELFAIAIAGGAGMHIGRAIAFPAGRTIADSAVAAGRTAATAMAGVVCMLVVAGGLEGVGRQTIHAELARFSIAGVMLLLWLTYLYMPRRPAGG